MSANLIMVDHASKDKRSVKAMLQGAGDGREHQWEFFKKAHPSLPMETLMEKFEMEVRYGRVGTKFKVGVLDFCKRWLTTAEPSSPRTIW